MLVAIDYEPIMPQELKAMRSVMLRRLDGHIVSHTYRVIEQKITTANKWCVLKEAVKIPNYKLEKVVFHSFEMSDKCIRDGLFMFQLFVRSSCISREEYFPIQTCYRCYIVEEGITAQCPEPSSLKLCSLCASRNYTWKRCKSEVKKCCNCGEHSTFTFEVRAKAYSGTRERERKKLIPPTFLMPLSLQNNHLASLIQPLLTQHNRLNEVLLVHNFCYY